MTPYEVRTLVREYMAGTGRGRVTASHVVSALAKDQNLDVYTTVKYEGIRDPAARRFDGQVRRALNQLADDGILEKHKVRDMGYGGGWSNKYELAQAAIERRRHRDEMAAVAEREKLARQRQGTEIISRLQELGVPATKTSDGRPVLVNQDDWLPLLHAAMSWRQYQRTLEKEATSWPSA